MRREMLESASGMRPTGVFACIVTVLGLAAVWVARNTVTCEPSPRSVLAVESDPLPAFSIEDRTSRPLARFVQRLDLVLSPNAMWQAHTPLRMAERISAALGGTYSPEDLLERFFPDAQGGVIRAGEIGPEEAERVEYFVRHGDLEGLRENGAPVEGIWIEDVGGSHVLCWEPVIVLSRWTRDRQGFGRDTLGWSRRLADQLALCFEGEAGQLTFEEIEDRRERIWRFMIPTTFGTAITGFDGSFAPELIAALREEGVAWHQMRVSRERDRRYPCGAFEVLGSWGFLDRESARSRALEEAGLGDAVLLDEEEEAWVRVRTWEHLTARHPRAGLEVLCSEVLTGGEWDFLERRAASFRFLRHRPARRGVRSYFIESCESSDPPSVRTTLDALLQELVGEHLDRLMEEHRPAVAEAIVIDVESGDVLAVDSRSDYRLDGFAPVFHAFTPGSSLKPIIMAAALEAGVVRPAETFDVGHGEFRLPGRIIREAEGHRTGILTASEILAYSMNAGMVQIGQRLTDTDLRGTLRALRYGEYPGTGLGTERAGYLPALPWRIHQTQASISFGHELMVSLWQHAGAVATLVRGGEYKPLRIVDAIVQNGEVFELPREPAERVLSEETCEEVREMMGLGFSEGTGSKVPGVELPTTLTAGTKTGTAQKVPSEICVHAELSHQQMHAGEGTRCSRACRRKLVGVREGHRTCYTSSMSVFGTLEGGREVLVIVVADEPRGSQKYGSKVAGPTAFAILLEALGGTRLGRVAVADAVRGFAPAELLPEAPPELHAGWGESPSAFDPSSSPEEPTWR